MRKVLKKKFRLLTIIMAVNNTEVKSAVVEKPVPVTYDFGNLAVFDINPLHSTSEEAILDTTRDNVQLLVNQILKLPIKKTTDSVNSSSTQDSTTVLISLPEPVSELPREKPLPKPKPPTKWELFAAKKGIQKKAKDGKLVYDEETGKWIPKWGYGGANKKLDDQWLVEVDEEKEKPDSKGDLIDPRTLSRMERKKLVKKNMLQQKRNAQRRS